MIPAATVILDIVLTAAANGLAENITVSDILKAAHAAGHEITDADLAKYVQSGFDTLAALHKVNADRKAAGPR